MLYSGELEHEPSLPGCHFAGVHLVGEDVGFADVGNRVGMSVTGLKEGSGYSLVGLLVDTTGCFVGACVVGLRVVDKLGSQTSCRGHSRPKNTDAQQAS